MLIHSLGASLAAGAAFLSWFSHHIDPVAQFSETIVFLAVMFCMCAFYAFACVHTLRRGTSWRAILLWAFLFRLIFVPSQPIYETDHYRYLWDGYCLSQGVNPYRYSPQEILDAYASPPAGGVTDELKPLVRGLVKDESLYHTLSNVNNPDLNTIYPPFAQIVFGAAASLFPNSLMALRAVMLLCDALLIILILALLVSLNLPLERIVFYAWSPLILKEYINTVHYDVIALFGLFLAVGLIGAGRKRHSALAFACAAQTKFFPLLALPPAARRWRVGAWVVFAATSFTLALIFINYASGRGWSAFLHRWESNSSMAALIEAVLIQLGAPPWGQGSVLFEWHGSAYRLDAFLIAKILCGLAFIAIYARLLWRIRGRDDENVKTILNFTQTALLALLIFSPICNPWYVAWLVPFLCFRPSAAALWLSCACLVYYVFFIWSPIQQPLWLRALEYCPFYAFLIYEWRYGPLLDRAQTHTSL